MFSVACFVFRVGLEKNLRLLSEHVDRMSAESARHCSYYKTLIKQQQLRQQHQYKKEQENILREKRGEPPLPQEDLDKLYKLPTAPPRHTHTYAQHSCTTKDRVLTPLISGRAGIFQRFD